MNLTKRIAYFSGGFAIGIIFLIFFFSGKKTSCAYGPDARTLKSIRDTEQKYSGQAQQFFVEYNIDTSSVNHILKTGDVNFSKSQTDLDSLCNTYNVYGNYEALNLELTIERCDSISTVQQINILKD